MQASNLVFLQIVAYIVNLISQSIFAIFYSKFKHIESKLEWDSKK